MNDLENNINGHADRSDTAGEDLVWNRESDLIYRQINAAVRGDESAFCEIMASYERLVYNLAWQYCRDPHDAADITQDVFIKLWKSLKKFRGDSSFSTWLYKITKNTCLDFLRRRAGKLDVPLPERGEGDTAAGLRLGYDLSDNNPDNDPQQRLEREERRRMVDDAIAALAPGYRELVVLRDMQGYTYSQIAEILGLELGTVKSRLNRARSLIKEFLEKQNFF